MDFIRNDKDLFAKLLKIGQEESNALSAEKNAEALDSILKNVEENLKDYVPPQPEAKFHGGAPGNPEPKLFLNDLQNPISFLNYLKNSQIKYRSTTLVYDHHPKTSSQPGLRILEDEVNSLSPAQQKEYIKYPKPIDNKQDLFTYWIHKKYVLLLLEDLQNSSKDNRLLETRVGKIIQELSTNSGESFNPDDQSPSDKTGLPQLLDTLPNIINTNNPGESGRVQLMDTDLKTVQDFVNWGSKNIAGIIAGKTPQKPISNDNICQLINHLYTRVYKGLNSGRNKDQDGKLAQYYAKQILTISNAYSCNIGQSPASGNTGDKQPGSGGRNATENLTDNDPAMLFKKLVPYLPLTTSSIDFKRISIWLQALDSALPPKDKFDGAAHITNLMQDAARLLKPSLSANASNYAFELSSSGSDVIQSLSQQNNYLPFLGKLVEIVNLVSESVRRLIVVYGEKLKADPEAYSHIVFQIGSSATGASIASQNKTMLNGLIYHANDLLRRS